jgi:hypothetical protein
MATHVPIGLEAVAFMGDGLELGSQRAIDALEALLSILVCRAAIDRWWYATNELISTGVLRVLTDAPQNRACRARSTARIDRGAVWRDLYHSQRAP